MDHQLLDSMAREYLGNEIVVAGSYQESTSLIPCGPRDALQIVAYLQARPRALYIKDSKEKRLNLS